MTVGVRGNGRGEGWRLEARDNDAKRNYPKNEENYAKNKNYIIISRFGAFSGLWWL